MSEAGKKIPSAIEKEFSSQDAEDIVKDIFGKNAFERRDRLGALETTENEHADYERVQELSSDLRSMWWKIENERVQIALQIDEASKKKDYGKLSARRLRALNNKLDDLTGRADALNEIQSIILDGKTPDKIMKFFDDLANDYGNNLKNEDFLKASGDENVKKVSDDLKTAIGELTNYKNQIKFINSNNNENFMPESTSKENFSIINIQKNDSGENVGRVADNELAQKMADKANKMHREWKEEIKDASNKEINEAIGPAAEKAMEDVFKNETGMEYEVAVREAKEEMKGVGDEVEINIKNDKEVIKDRAAGIGNEDVKNNIIDDGSMAGHNFNNEVINAKNNAEGEMGEIKTESSGEEPIQGEVEEVKDEKIEVVKRGISDKIKNIDGKIKILENSHGNPGDRRLYIAREAGIDIKQLTPKEEDRQKLIILARHRAEKAELQKVEEITNNSEIKNYDELQDRLWDNYKSARNEFTKKNGELNAFRKKFKGVELDPKEKEQWKKMVEEKRDLQAKMQIAEDSVDDFDARIVKEREEKNKKRQMKNQKAPKPEPTGEPQEPKAVDRKINKDAAQAENEDDLRKLRQQLSDERKKKIKAGDMEGAKKLGLEVDDINLRVSFKEDGSKNKKSGDEKNSDIKAQKSSEPAGEPQGPDASEPQNEPNPSSKNPTEQENDEAESKNGKKAEEEKKSADESKEEFRRAPDDPKSETGKEKTPEDILREKNIELYGGPEKFNKIIDAYQKLNELVDNKADSVDDKGKPLNEKLFKEWDELRVNLAGKKIVIMDEKMGIKSIHGKYEIKNPEEKIRKFYDKLNEPVEAFAADSAEDTIIRAATLAKHRNELAERLSRAKNANLEVQIKDLDKKIEVLNEKMGERRDPSRPEISIANLLINNFEKAGNKESVEEKLNKEAEEIESELENTPKEERKKLGLGIRTFGFFLQEQKSKGLAKMCEWLSGAANKASGQELNSAGKVKSIETAGSMTRFLASLSETYRRDEKRARQGIDQDPETLKQGTWRQLQNAGFLSGNILKYGRTVADVAGWTAGSPLRWFMIGSQLFTRGAEAAKYARLKNADVINKTRLGFEKIEGAAPEQMKEYEQAVDEAYKIYEQAKESATQQGIGKVTTEAIEQVYLEQLPQDILNRMKKAEPGTATGVVERIAQKAFQKYIELSIKAGKFTKIGFQKRLKEYDAMISKYGTVDALAMSAKLAETAGKTVIAATTVETAYLALKNLPVIFERIENAGSGTTGSGHGIFSGLKEAIVGKRILSHDGGAPGGGGRSEKSFFGAFADNQSKDHDMFPWQKPTTYSPEIPIGQGSFAERFLRAVGIHEGSPAKPELQNIFAEYSEYFKHHPGLLNTQGAGNKNSLEFFSHLKSDLQNAGLDGRAADEIVKNFSFEMGKVGTGYYPEGEALSGIEATGAGTGAGAGGSAAENTITAAGAGKTIDAVIGAKQDIVNSAVETASGKMNSVWKMIDHQLDQRGIFKGLTGTPEEIAAKKTYMIDYFKDIVAKDLKGFGLKDIDDLRVGQKVDLSKLFESHPRLGEIIRDTNVLSADKLSSIYEHNQTIAEFHRLHPDVGITSENVDQIAAGHGDALLKKAVEQAVDQTAVAAPVGPVGPQKPPVVNEWHDFGGKKPEFKSPIDDLGFKEAQVDKIASEKIGDRLNKIFDYTFGKQGAETSTYQNVKNEIADNFLKRKLSGEVDVNDPFAIDRDDARRYGELQEYLKELAKENNSAPKTGETVAEFIKRAASKAARGEVGKAMESPIDKKSELI